MYNCTRADNGRPLRSKQKMLYLCNKTVLEKTLFYYSCIRSTEAVGIALWPPCSLGWQNSGNEQTDTHTHRPSTVTASRNKHL